MGNKEAKIDRGLQGGNSSPHVQEEKAGHSRQRQVLEAKKGFKETSLQRIEGTNQARVRKTVQTEGWCQIEEGLGSQEKEFNLDMAGNREHLEDSLKNGDQESGRLTR